MNDKSQNIQSSILLEFKQGKKKTAILKQQEYLINNSKDNDARLNLAYMYVNSNLINEAVKEYKIVLKNKQDLQVMFNLAICFLSLNKFVESEKLLKKIIKIDKSHFKAHRSLGDIYFKQNNLNKAFKFLNTAKQIISDDPILLNTFGLIEMKRNNFEVSEKYFLESLKRKKNYKSALNNLAALYQKTGQISKSVKIFKKLLLIFPNDQNLLNNLGNVLIDLNLYEEAIINLKKAININSSESSFFSNLGRALFFYGKYKDAEEMLNNSLDLNPNNHEALLIFFYILIIKKDLKKAWHYFNSRLNVKNYFIPNNLKLINNIKDIKNKKILVLREAGLGDEILFSSIYTELIKQNNNVIIECDHRLKNIYKRSFNYDKFISKSSFLRSKSNLIKYDFSIYAGSLCGIFRKNLSDFNYNEYLKPNIKKVKYFHRKLRNINLMPKIGISWISTRLDLGKDKSVDLKELLPILKRKNFSFVNLQYGDFNKKIYYFNKKYNLNIIDIPELDKFKDIEGLLALISGLDLVITVRNTTAHLSGSIGKQTLLLAPDNRAQLFYWMLSKNKTPWYPSIKIFKKNINWNEAINNIQLYLNKSFKIK